MHHFRLVGAEMLSDKLELNYPLLCYSSSRIDDGSVSAQAMAAFVQLYSLLCTTFD